jgi:hypothetical protein
MQSLCNIGDWILKFKNQSSKIYQRKMDGIDGKSDKGITGKWKSVSFFWLGKSIYFYFDRIKHFGIQLQKRNLAKEIRYLLPR